MLHGEKSRGKKDPWKSRLQRRLFLWDSGRRALKITLSTQVHGSHVSEYLTAFAANPVLKGATTEGQSFLIVQTPEPLTLILLSAGLLGLAGLRRKKSK